MGSGCIETELVLVDDKEGSGGMRDNMEVTETDTEDGCQSEVPGQELG